MILATAWAYFSLLTARLSMYPTKLDTLANRIFLTWALCVPLSTLFSSGFIPMAGSALLLLILTPKERLDRVVYFMGVFPAVIDAYDFMVPFPGMNYLIELTHFKIAVLVVLLPIVLSNLTQQRKTDPMSWNIVDTFVVALSIYIALMSLRDATFTAMLRNMVDQMITVVVPYFAITRTLCSKESLDKALWGLYLTAVITAWIILISSLIQWEFYRIHSPGSFAGRNNFLRVGSTMNTASVCTAVTCGFVIAEYLKDQLQLSKLQVWIQRPAFIAALFFTGNRGGWLQLILAVLAIFILKRFGKGARRVIFVSGVIGAFFAFPSIDWASIDRTFEFRAELIEASMPQFYDYPMFGQPNYSASPHFDVVAQYGHSSGGRRFIDVVNWYLQMLLAFGLVGAILFAMQPLSAASKLHKRYSLPETSAGVKSLCLYAFAMLSSFIIVIGTTSGMSLMPAYFILLVAFGRAIATSNRSELVQVSYPRSRMSRA